MSRALLLMLLATAGCGYRAPGVRITGASIGARGPDAVQVIFEATVTNPNAQALELDELGYRLTVEGREVYTGRRAPGANLASLGEQRLALPAVIPLGAVSAETPLVCRLSGWLRYRTPGQIAQRLFDTGVRRPKTGFRYEARLVLEAPSHPSQPTQAPPAAQPARSASPLPGGG